MLKRLFFLYLIVISSIFGESDSRQDYWIYVGTISPESDYIQRDDASSRDTYSVEQDDSSKDSKLFDDTRDSRREELSPVNANSEFEHFISHNTNMQESWSDTSTNEYIERADFIGDRSKSVNRFKTFTNKHDWVEYFRTGTQDFSDTQIISLFAAFTRYKYVGYVEFLKSFPQWGFFMKNFYHNYQHDKIFTEKINSLNDNGAVKALILDEADEELFAFNKSFDEMTKIFAGEKYAIAAEIVQTNTVFERMRQWMPNSQNATNIAGIDYSVIELKTQDNQIIPIRIIRSENASANSRSDTKFIGAVYDPTTKSYSMVYAKQGEYIEVSVNQALLKKFTRTDRDLFADPNQVHLLEIEASHLLHAMSFVLDFIPIVNTIKSTVEVIAGIDYITGQKLTATERGFATLGAMPIVGWIAKGARFVKSAKGVTKVLAKSNKVVSLAKRGIDKAKDVFKTRKVVKLSQQQIIEKIKDVVIKNGKPIGNPGSEKIIRELPGGEKAAKAFYGKLIQKGGLTSKASKTKDGKHIFIATIQGKQTITYRPISTSGPPTIEFRNIPEFEKVLEKIKFK